MKIGEIILFILVGLSVGLLCHECITKIIKKQEEKRRKEQERENKQWDLECQIMRLRDDLNQLAREVLLLKGKH